jgi:outer membrane protein assembly factor BamA
MLTEHNQEGLTYNFINESKVIDDISFNHSISISNNILEKIFSPLHKMDHSKSAEQFVRKIRSSYPFIPEDVKIQFGRIEHDRLGALIDFTPDFNSHFSGIIGAIQNNEKKWDYSGEIDIRLENTWKTASTTDIIWKRQNEKSQYTRFMHEEPYPFGLPFGVKFEFLQDFRDGNYVLNKTYGAFSVTNNLGKWYLGGSKEELAPTTKGDSSGIKSFRSDLLSITFTGDNRNDRWLPRKGSFLDVSTEIGEINKKRLTFRFDMLYEKLFSLSNYFSFQMKFRNSGVWNSGEIDSVYVGQLIRYGGHNSIRGYQEDIFRDDFVSVNNFNILFIPNNNMQLYTFADVAFNDEFTIKYSRGLGLRQRTRNSVIEISFGWPRDEAFSAGKVHVKFTSLLD